MNGEQFDRTKLNVRPRAGTALLLAALGLAVFAGTALGANLVKNSSFETDTNGDGIPNGWVGGALTSGDKRVCNQSYAGACSFKMTPDGSEKSLVQVIDVSGTSGLGYTLSLWTKGKDLDLSGGAMRVFLHFIHTGGGSNFELIDVPAGTSAWVKRTISGSPTADFDEIRVSVVSFATSGKAWFDKVKLVEAP